MDVEKWWGTVDPENQFELEFERSIKSQDREKNRGRAAVIDFSISSGVSFETYEEPNEFKKRLESLEFKEFLAGRGGRFLIVLEDLSRAWIELLGPRIAVPVSVFALHMARPIDHFLGKARVPLGESPDRRFVLTYQQPVPLKVLPQKRGKAYRINCTAIRTFNSTINADEREAETSAQLVSYWGKKFQSPGHVNAVHEDGKEDGPWIAILLVDPCPALEGGLEDKGRHNMGEEPILRDESPTLVARSYKHIPVLSQDGDTPKLVSKEDKPERSAGDGPKSFFDELLLPDYGHPTSLPSSATYRCRRLVLAKAAAVVSSAMARTLALTKSASSGVQDIAEFNFDKFDEISWRDSWRGEFFTNLWELREDLEIMGRTFKQNRKVIERIKQLSKVEDSEQQAQDLLEWDNLLDMKDYAFTMMARTTDSYLQTVQATGAQFANLQARSVGRLTGLASLFFPASLCAAVLAIPSFTGAGDVTKFWIFWAVSVPLAAILGILLMSPIPGWFKKYWEKSKEKSRKRGDLRRRRRDGVADLER